MVSAALNILINFLLIPELGATGCAIAAIFSQYLCGLACFINASAKLNLPLKLPAVLFYACTGIVMWIVYSLQIRWGWDGFTALGSGGIILALIMFVKLRPLKKWSVE
jgi:hypothetical protein